MAIAQERHVSTSDKVRSALAWTLFVLVGVPFLSLVALLAFSLFLQMLGLAANLLGSS